MVLHNCVIYTSRHHIFLGFPRSNLSHWCKRYLITMALSPELNQRDHHMSDAWPACFTLFKTCFKSSILLISISLRDMQTYICHLFLNKINKTDFWNLSLRHACRPCNIAFPKGTFDFLDLSCQTCYCSYKHVLLDVLLRAFDPPWFC